MVDNFGLMDPIPRNLAKPIKPGRDVVGTWGIDPKQNDGSHDAVSLLCIDESFEQAWKSKRWRKSGSRSQDAWERIGLLQLTTDFTVLCIPKSIIVEAVSDLKRISEDEAWIDGWKSPAVIRTSIDRALSWLRDTLKKNGRKRMVTVCSFDISGYGTANWPGKYNKR